MSEEAGSNDFSSERTDRSDEICCCMKIWCWMWVTLGNGIALIIAAFAVLFTMSYWRRGMTESARQEFYSPLPPFICLLVLGVVFCLIYYELYCYSHGSTFLLRSEQIQQLLRRLGPSTDEVASPSHSISAESVSRRRHSRMPVSPHVAHRKLESRTLSQELIRASGILHSFSVEAEIHRPPRPAEAYQLPTVGRSPSQSTIPAHLRTTLSSEEIYVDPETPIVVSYCDRCVYEDYTDIIPGFSVHGRHYCAREASPVITVQPRMTRSMLRVQEKAEQSTSAKASEGVASDPGHSEDPQCSSPKARRKSESPKKKPPRRR